MINRAVAGEVIPDLGRSEFTSPDKYFPRNIKQEWRSEIKHHREFLTSSSGDTVTKAKILKLALSELGCETDLSNLPDDFLVNIFKIKCGVNRQLADPYSGCLATRDILFCRKESQLSPEELVSFNRTQGLIFLGCIGKTSRKDKYFYFSRAQEKLFKAHSERQGEGSSKTTHRVDQDGSCRGN